MAIVTSISRDRERSIRSPNPTKTTCSFLVGSFHGEKLVQLNTTGSQSRENPGITSQTLQFTRQSAEQLYRLLKSEFDFKE